LLVKTYSDVGRCDQRTHSAAYYKKQPSFAHFPAVCGPVLRRIFAGGAAAGHTDTQFLQAQCVAADPAGVGITGAQSKACIYG